MRLNYSRLAVASPINPCCLFAGNFSKPCFLLLAICWLSAAQGIHAQTTWDGSASTDWFNTDNWSAGVPDAADDVTIPNVTLPNVAPVIMGGTAALAKSVWVQPSATLTINATGSLTINGSRTFGSFTAGFYNQGTVSNTGNLILGSTASVGTYGIFNEATFNNNLGGGIQIDRSTDTGLYNQAGSFTNSATISIGTLAAIGKDGLFNNAIITNNSPGLIQINRSFSAGISNLFSATFTNSASIVIGSVASVGTWGLLNQATFTNNSGGEISIDRSTFSGLTSSGTFTNAAKITIGAVASVGGLGIQNGGTFNNSTCTALINIVSNAIINNSSTFSNAGLIIENASGNSSITSNAGIVQNFNGGTFTIGTNTGILTTTTGDIWTGCVSTDWATPGNWADGSVPTATDDVVIPNVTNQPSIGAAGALAKSVAVQASATLTVTTAGVLTIDDWADKALSNLGTVTNNGTIVVGPTVSTANFGIYNEGTFNNNLTGQLTLDRGFVTNLRNLSGTFNNAGTITIGSIVGARFGIWNSAQFNNLASGQITIDQVSSQGGPQGLYNNGTFDNAGSLTIGGNGGGGETGLQNFSVFNNLSGGQVKVDRTSTAAVGQYGGTFTNASSIIIGANAGVGTFGIWVQAGTFNNNTGGQIQIDRAGNSGINNQSGFTNAATITIGAVSSMFSGIANTGGSFTNSPCSARIEIVSNSIISLNGGTISNAGLIIENASGNSAISTNTGIVQNLNGGTFTVGSGNPPITNPAPLVNACCTPPNAAIAITENNVIFDPFTNRAYYNASYTDGILCTGPAVPNPSTSATLTASGGGTYLWSTNATTAAITVSTAGTYTVTVTTAPGCTSTAARTISVNSAPNPGTISATPQIFSQGTLGVCWGSTIQLSSTVSGGVWSAQNKSPQIVSISSGGIVTPLFTSADVDTNSVYYTVTSLGCYNSSRSTVGVIDPRNPGTISGNTTLCPGNPSQLTSNGQSGGVWASSNTAVATVSSTGLVTPVNNVNNGTTTISYTLYGFSTNPSTACPYSATALVTVAPCCPGPAALCKPANAVLVGNSATLLPASVDNGSTAACGLQSITVSPNTFNCSQIGTPQTVTLRVTDVNNASNACTATVTVIDNTPPSITCPPNATVNANASCQGTVGAYSAATLADNCNPLPTVTQSPASSTVMTGHNTAQTVTLTANDGNGNTATCSLTVTLKDVTPPNVICPGNQFANVGANCIAPMPNYAGSLSYSDNCSSTSNTQTPAFGTPLALGTSTTLTLIVSDVAGNTASCVFNVITRDVTPPSITCPANATVPAGATCTATLASYTAAATANDNCTANPTKTQSPVSGTIITGTQIVTLTATDAANNSRVCTFTVTVADQTAPGIICPANATVQASANCTATLASYTAAATANDNCTANPTKTQSPASGTIIAGSQIVTLTATDAANNSTACTFTVTVADQTAPSIICPANATVPAGATCTATLASYTAAATANDNCTANPTKMQSPVFGTIIAGSQIVTLTATDAANNSAACTFTVTVADQTAPTITCPANATVPAGATCTATLASYTAAATANDNCTANPSKMQSPVSGTIITGSQIVTLTATDAASNSTACTFTVTVVDQTAPTITCPPNTTLAAGANCTTALGTRLLLSKSDNCTAGGSITETQSPLPTATISGHNTAQIVTLTATDGSGNSQTCQFTVTLKDVTAPTLICPSNQTAVPAQSTTCMALVNGINAVAQDNCGLSLAYTLTGATTASGNGQASGLTFNSGVTTVTYTATDAGSNTVSCTFTVGVSPCVNGRIIWKQDNTTGVKDVTVAVTGDQTTSALTGLDGKYGFIFPGGSNFTITPTKNINKLNGVNAQDVFRFQQHLMGNLVTDPWQLIAMDANSDNTINSLDLSIIQQSIMGNPQALALFVKSWRFVPTSHTLTNPPWGFPERIILTGASGNQVNKDFYGVKVGDIVALYANPANLNAAPPFVLTAPDHVLQAGNEIAIDLRADQISDLAAFQFGLHFDTQRLELQEIQSLTALPLTNDNFGLYEKAEGNINVLWAGNQGTDVPEAAPVFRLTFKVLTSGGKLSDALQLNEDVLLPRAYKTNLAESVVSLRFLGVSGTNNPGVPDHLVLYQNQPNPFVTHTMIGFELPQACTAQLRIFDAAGRLIEIRNKQYAAGVHSEAFDLDGAAGVLYYELTTPFGVLTKKMVGMKK